jgi:hypothetical protein
MKLGKATVSSVSLWIMAIQLAIVSTVAVKYLYQRWTCPRVWVRGAVYDPEMLMRGRYLSLQPEVNGCLDAEAPAAQSATAPARSGTPAARRFSAQGVSTDSFPALLKVQDGKLRAIRVTVDNAQSQSQRVDTLLNSDCAHMRLETPVDFYISEHVQDPSALKSGQELWVELTVPPKGPPRPLQLALKDNGAWKPLNLQ